MLNGYKKTFSLFGGQMEEILVVIYFLSCFLLYQPRTERIYSFILKWTSPCPAGQPAYIRPKPVPCVRPWTPRLAYTSGWCR